MKCFKEVGYIKLDLCMIFEEEYKAQEYCIYNEDYYYTWVDPDAVCLLVF